MNLFVFLKDDLPLRGRGVPKCVVSDALASDSPGVPIKTAESVPHLTCTESESQGVNPTSLHSFRRRSPSDS